MSKKILVYIFAVVFLLTALVIITPRTFRVYIFYPETIEPKDPFEVKSIDTMKYSRDLSGQMLNDPASFKKMVDSQLKLIADSGATHVSIGTPYDEQFIPVLALWVKSAREHNLSVWYRGNFSGWEGWFGYEKIDRDAHKKLLINFIYSHQDLFKSGDVFSPCPECENGGPGDPRNTGDKKGYNRFLVDEYLISKRAFESKGKDISVYFSMNGDIARDIIDKTTAKLLGGTILVDHYVESPEKFAKDIISIGQKINARIGVGEFGAPIPDLNGWMSENQQAQYVESMLELMYTKSSGVSVLNYWVLSGGSTSLLSDNGVPKKVYYVIKKYFSLPKVVGFIIDPLGNPVEGATINIDNTQYDATSHEDGSYAIFFPPQHRSFSIKKENYETVDLNFDSNIASTTYKNVVLKPVSPNLKYKIQYFFMSLRGKIFVTQEI